MQKLPSAQHAIVGDHVVLFIPLIISIDIRLPFKLKCFHWQIMRPMYIAIFRVRSSLMT